MFANKRVDLSSVIVSTKIEVKRNETFQNYIRWYSAPLISRIAKQYIKIWEDGSRD